MFTLATLTLSLLASLSDLATMKAHWEDVAVGLALGISVAVYIVSCNLTYIYIIIRRQAVIWIFIFREIKGGNSQLLFRKARQVFAEIASRR